MKKILFFLILSLNTILTFAEKPIGDIDIKVDIYPYGTTKAYDLNGSSEKKLILDAGIINSADGLRDQKLAEVYVYIKTKKNGEYKDGEHDACTIDGDFNGLLYLEKLSERFEGTGNRIPLTTLKKYKGGENAVLELKAENFRITHRNILDPDPSDETYSFTAYPENCVFSNKVIELGYKFDLILKATNVEKGDIVRGDISLPDNKAEATSGRGALEDLIHDQMTSIMEKKEN